MSGNMPLVVIVGQTASGKSALALKLAQAVKGEIISADSRMIYKYMDIGTAKPSPKERELVRHHLLDVVEPDQLFTVADYKREAVNAIKQIRQRRHVPILAGGTGLYVDAVVFDYQFRERYSQNIRQALEDATLARLQELAVAAGYASAANEKNRRRLIRLLESGESTDSDRSKLTDNVIMVGLRLDRAQLRRNIEIRIERMFKQGLRREVETLVKRYGWEHEALTGIGYREFEAYYLKEVSMSQVKRQILQHTLQYAKRQQTWFKRNPHINWFDDALVAERFVMEQLRVPKQYNKP